MNNDDPRLLTGGDASDGISGAGADTSPARGFEFTISGGTVTAVQAVDGAHTFDLHIPNDATFTVGDGTVTETLAGTHATTVIDYAAEAGDPSLYQVASVTETIGSPTTVSGNGVSHGFAFTVANGTVTAEQLTFGEGGHSHSETVPIPADAQFTIGSGTITETVARGGEVETQTYVQPAGQTLYALASDQTRFIAPGSATTRLDIEPGERDQFTIAPDGSVTAAERVHADGSTSAIALGGRQSFTQLAPGLVEEVDTFGNHTSYEVFATGSGGGGVYLAVAHGEGSTVDVAGLDAQLAQLPSIFTTEI